MMHTITTFRHEVQGILWITLTLYSVIGYTQVRTSVQSGNWSNKNTWDCACVPGQTEDAVIASGHVVTRVAANTIRNLTANTGAILTDNGQPITITGSVIMNGTYSGSGEIRLTATTTMLDGQGTFSNSADMIIASQVVVMESARLTINSSEVWIAGPYTITNRGTITIGGNVNGTVASSSWINEANAVLNIGGSSGVPLMATGILQAHASGNTIHYYGTHPHTLKLPAQVGAYHTYHHLVIAGAATKTMPDGEVAVNGDLTIMGTLSGSGSSKKIYLRGNWINNGNFTEGSGEGTVIFDGTTDQLISRATTENMNVVVVNKSSGRVLLNTNLIAERGLTMLQGDMDTRSFKVTLGLSTTTPGILSWTSGAIIGRVERWVANTPGATLVFPVGTSDHDRPASITLNSLTPGSLEAAFVASAPGRDGLQVTESGVTLYNTFRDGYWTFKAANGLTSDNLNLALTANGFTGFNITGNTRLLARNPGASWILTGAHGMNSGTTIRRMNMGILPGEYALGDETNCHAPALANISGNNQVCSSAFNEGYAVPHQAGNAYAWKVTGGMITAGQGTHSITVQWGSVGMEGEVSVVEQNACTAGPEARLPVTIHALPPSAISGKLNVPEQAASPETYSITPQPNYRYAWTVTGGTITSGQGTPSIIVLWGSTGTGSVCVQGTHDPALPAASCGQSITSCTAISIYRVIASVRSGNWQSPATWNCACLPTSADNLLVRSTHTISMTANRTSNHLTIQPGGILNTNSNTLTIQGDLSIHGRLSGTGTVILAGNNTLWDGTGVITNTGPWTIAASKTIPATATLIKGAGTVTLNANVVVTNRGSITLGGNLTGTDASRSEWVNAAQATLAVAGEVLLTGKLHAAATGNTVRFTGSGSQQIPVPEGGQYGNISFAGSGVKTIPSGVLNISGQFINDGNVQFNKTSTIAFNGTTSVLGSTVTTFRHITLKTGSSLTLPPGLVNITGDLEVESGSAFDPASGTLALTGDSIQTLHPRGASAYRLRVNKANGAVNILSMLNILHRLEIESPTTVNANDNLIIRSRGITTDLDAGIGALPAGAAIAGNVTVQRYMQALGNANRYIASPVADITASAQLQDDFILGNGVIRYYDEAVPGISNNGYRNQPLTALWQTGRGYLAWMYEGNKNITWDVHGIIHQGSVNLPIRYTATSGGPLNDGWNLLGNPYPSAIQWNGDAKAWTRSADISPVVYVTDNKDNVFRLYNHLDNSGDLTAGVIAMGQAFWVKASSTTAAITIHEQAKSTNANGKFYRSALEPSKQATVSLSHEGATDVAYLKSNRQATPGFDEALDAYKLKNTNINVYFMDAANQELAMHTLAEVKKDDIIRLGIEGQESGTYQLSFAGLTNLHQGEWYLIDRQEGVSVPVSEDVPYEFVVTTPAKTIHQRFALSRTSPDLKESIAELVDAYPNPVLDILQIRVPPSATSRITLLDTMGAALWTGEGSSLMLLDMQSYASGIYMLRIDYRGQTETRKIIKK